MLPFDLVCFPPVVYTLRGVHRLSPSKLHTQVKGLFFCFFTQAFLVNRHEFPIEKRSCGNYVPKFGIPFSPNKHYRSFLIWTFTGVVVALTEGRYAIRWRSFRHFQIYSMAYIIRGFACSHWPLYYVHHCLSAQLQGRAF